MSWPGDIVAMGDEVRGFRLGQRVVAANSAPCGECFFCQRGQENLCDDLLFNNGAYAEYIRIPAAHCREKHVRSSGARQLSGRGAGGAAGLRAARPGRDRPAAGDTVAVIGLGPIGMMFVRLAKAVYGARVIAIGRRQPQLDRAHENGRR